MNSLKSFVTSQSITRLIIISYFIAVALNVIPGIEISRMAEPFMPELYAQYTMRALVLILCGMVLFGVFRRAAALVLALVVFWTSYISLYSGGELGSFWRDLALIGALLMAANSAAREEKAKTADAEADKTHNIKDVFGESVREEPEGHGQFREDFDIVSAT